MLRPEIEILDTDIVEPHMGWPSVGGPVFGKVIRLVYLPPRGATTHLRQRPPRPSRRHSLPLDQHRWRSQLLTKRKNINPTTNSTTRPDPTTATRQTISNKKEKTSLHLPALAFKLPTTISAIRAAETQESTPSASFSGLNPMVDAIEYSSAKPTTTVHTRSFSLAV